MLYSGSMADGCIILRERVLKPGLYFIDAILLALVWDAGGKFLCGLVFMWIFSMCFFPRSKGIKMTVGGLEVSHIY